MVTTTGRVAYADCESYMCSGDTAQGDAMPGIVQPRLDTQVAVEALLVIASKLGEQGKAPDLHSLGHLLYLADKTHLERYGRMISGERFHALRYGPTPSGTYASLKILADRDPGVAPPEAFLLAMAGAFEHVDGYTYRALREPQLDYLSRSARECIDEVLTASRNWNFSDLTEATHDEAYGSVWNRRENGAIPIELIASTFTDCDALVQHLLDPHPE